MRFFFTLRNYVMIVLVCSINLIPILLFFLRLLSKNTHALRISIFAYVDFFSPRFPLFTGTTTDAIREHWRLSLYFSNKWSFLLRTCVCMCAYACVRVCSPRSAGAFAYLRDHVASFRIWECAVAPTRMCVQSLTPLAKSLHMWGSVWVRPCVCGSWLGSSCVWLDNELQVRQRLL